MTFTEKLLGNYSVGFKSVVIALLFIGASHVSFSQMTTREMDNFKKLDKAKKKKKKQKGPSINTKKRSSAPKKTRQKKSGFTKKHYKLTYIIKEEDLLNISV